MSSSALNAVPLNFLSFISSETYEVVAESGQKHFFVHNSVLAARPESLFTIQRWGPKKIDLSNWDGDTVGRLIEFLYIGNYRSLAPESTVDGGEAIEKVWTAGGKTEAADQADSLDTAQSLDAQGYLGPLDTGVNGVIL